MSDNEIIAYKGFDKNLQCRGYQYEVGKTYEHAGKVEACSSGFHSCENPFDVWGYYNILDDNRFCTVKIGGEISREGGRDTKIASGKITIEAELRLPDFIKKCVDFIISTTAGKAEVNDNGGNYARIGSSGYYAQIGSSGDGAQIGSSGNYAQIGSSGNYARIGSSGDGARIGSSGNDARIGSSGYGARIGSSGNDARIGSSGYGARIEISGNRGVACSADRDAKAKGSNGAWLSLAEFEYVEGRYICVGFATGCIGVDGLKEGVWYKALGGKLVEA